jgi:hypothetical protein
MSTSEPAKKSRLLKLALLGVGILFLGIATFFAWGALEQYVFAEQIHLLTSEKNLHVGMTQEEVENIFGVKPEDRKATDPNVAAMWPPRPHDGVMRYTEMGDREGTYHPGIYDNHPNNSPEKVGGVEYGWIGGSQ